MTRLLARFLGVILALTACDGSRSPRSEAGDAGTADDASTTNSPVKEASKRGDLTDYYDVHVEVTSDTCHLPTASLADRETILSADRATGIVALQIPGGFGIQEIPFEHDTIELQPERCPDTHLTLETGPVEISQDGHHIVVPCTESWRHTDDCSAEHRSAATAPPPADCQALFVMTYDWSRHCPTAPRGHSGASASMPVVAYCD